MRQIFRRFSVVLVIAVIVAGIVYAFRPQPVSVATDEVTLGPMQVTIDEEGETRIRERFIVSAPVSGRIQRISLEPGDPVEAGRTVIATLLPAEPTPLDVRTRTEALARVRQAEAALGQAIANRSRVAADLEFAQSQRNRYADLFEDGLVSRESYDSIRAEARSLEETLNTADFEVSNMERAVEVAQAALVEQEEGPGSGGGTAPVTVRSPIDGVVLRRMRESEAVVPIGEPLVEIGDLTELEIVSDLLSADAVQVRAGDRVLIEQWGGGTTLEGRVRRIEPSGFTKLSALGVEEQRVNVIIDFVDPEEAARRLGDGYRVEVRIVTWETDETLVVPTGSLFRNRLEEWAVFVVVGGRVERRSVEIGQRNGIDAQVLSGLSESERVVVHPGDDVVDGVEVLAGEDE